MRITLEEVETLEAIARNGTFQRAAKAMHKAQSAVSYAIHQLEDHLGVLLFDRTGHRAVLTDAGRVVLEEGRVLLARARRIETIAERLVEDWEPRLEVVIDGIVPMDPILRALKALSDEGVPTQIQIKVEFLGGVQRRFELDRADAMLVKDYTESRVLVEHRLAPIDVVLVAASNHPIHALGAPASLADLRQHVELTVRDSSDSRRDVDARMFGCPRVFFMSDFGSKKQAIRMGLGFGWLPRDLVRVELASGEVREVLYEAGSRYRFVPRFVHPAARPLGRAGQALLRLLTAAGATHAGSRRPRVMQTNAKRSGK